MTDKLIDVELRPGPIRRVLEAAIAACQMQHAMLVLGGARRPFFKGRPKRRGHRFAGVDKTQRALHDALIRAGVSHRDWPARET
jgi:hypothetical protein